MNADGTRGAPCAKAFAYRAHSGFFGIVNSEEGYQNLTRFLFGDVRVDIWLDVSHFELPTQVDAKQRTGKKVDALYQVELLAAPRGKLWYLSRRTAEEDSVACITHSEWTKKKDHVVSAYLSTAFLAIRARANKSSNDLAYSLNVGIRVPDYEVDNILWLNDHYEGGYLFRDTLLTKFIEPKSKGEKWTIKRGWLGRDAETDLRTLSPTPLGDGKVELTVPLPVKKQARPRVEGQMRFVVSTWNPDAVLAE